MDKAGEPFFRQFLAKYKYGLVILMVGILLMLMPTGTKQSKQEVTMPSAAMETAVDSMEERLAEILSQVAGAGKVQVLLTEATGAQTFYQENRDSTEGNQNKSTRTDTVILSDSSRGQTGLVSQINPPTYLGAIVLCQGADQSAVRLAITEAVANATGLGYHKISVLKMK